MAYDEHLAERIRKNIKHHKKHIVEKNMFGGVAFMYKDKMACGVIKDELMIRVVSNKYEASLKLKHARVMNFTGKAMKDFLYVDPKGFQKDSELLAWIELGIEHAMKNRKDKN